MTLTSETGTPHKEAIDSAFINHDMFDLGLSLVDGEPTSIDLSGHTFTVHVADTTTEHEQGWAHAMLRMLENGTSFWESFPMVQISPQRIHPDGSCRAFFGIRVRRLL